MNTLYQLNENIAKELSDIEARIEETKRPTNFLMGWYSCLQIMSKQLINIQYEQAKEYSAHRKEIDGLKDKIKELEGK